MDNEEYKMKATARTFQIVYIILSAIISLVFAIILCVTLIQFAVEKSNAEAKGGMNDEIGLTISFEASQLHDLAIELAEVNYKEQIEENPNYLEENPNLVVSVKSTILAVYQLKGTTYWYKLYPEINKPLLILSISFMIFGIYSLIMNAYCYYVIKKKSTYSVTLAVISILSLNIPSGVLIAILSNNET